PNVRTQGRRAGAVRGGPGQGPARVVALGVTPPGLCARAVHRRAAQTALRHERAHALPEPVPVPLVRVGAAPVDAAVAVDEVGVGALEPAEVPLARAGP